MNNSNQLSGYKVVVQSSLNTYANPETYLFKISDYIDAKKEAIKFRQKMAKNKKLKVTCIRYY